MWSIIKILLAAVVLTMLVSCAELKKTTSLRPAVEMKNNVDVDNVPTESRLSEWNLDVPDYPK